VSNPPLRITPGPTPAGRAAPPPLALPLALPPALTYLLARIVADSDHRAHLGRPPATARLARVLHDTERALETSGLAADEVDAALRDVVEGLTWTCTTPEAYGAIIDVAMALFASRTAPANAVTRQRRVG
jgi:hypothetical protein